MLCMTQISATAVDRREEARQPSGLFGHQTHTAPEATLLTVEDIDAANDRREAERAERQMFAEVLEGVERAADMYASRRGQMNDRNDIVGDTILDIVGQQKRGTTHINDEAFKQYSTRAVSSRYVDPNAHHTTLKARRFFNAESEKFMQEHGREMTTREREELADSIRLAAPPKHRPAIGFEKKQIAISLDLEVGEDGSTTIGDLLPSRGQDSDNATSTSMAAEVNDALEDESSSYKAADARKNIWNILVQDDGPNVAVKSLKDDRAHRSLVAAAGGAAAVALAWQEGETAEDDPVNDALFAPFGSLSEKEREQVTQVLLRNPAYAEKVWDSAMAAALDVQALRTIKRKEARQAAKAAAQAA